VCYIIIFKLRFDLFIITFATDFVTVVTKSQNSRKQLQKSIKIGNMIFHEIHYSRKQLYNNEYSFFQQR